MMRRIALAVFAAVLGTSAALAAEMKDVGDIPLGSVVVPQASAGQSGPVADAAVGAAVARAMGIADPSSLRLLGTSNLPKNRGRSIRYSQLYRGIPILDQQVVVRQSPNGRLLDASGTAVFGIAATTTPAPKPKLSADEALQIGIDSVVPKPRKRSSQIENPTSELVYRLDDRGNLQLVYKVSFFTTVYEGDRSRPTRPVLFVDAQTGKILDSYENLQHIDPDYLDKAVRKGTGPGGNEKTGRYQYGRGVFPKFLVTKVGDDCLMDADDYLQTEDMKNSSVATDEPFSFDCFNNPGIAVNGGYSPMNDAQAMGEVVYDLYTNWYSTFPLTKDRKLLLRVRYAEPDGDIDNAFWNGVAMTFGNGKNIFYPPVSLDVTGHEVSHGFTEFHSGLLYFGQSGGINEAYSDMAGVATEAYFAETYGQPFDYKIPNFTVGQEVWRGEGKALRYMCDPPRDGRSIDHASKFVEGMNPHLSSGIYNKAFCLLAKSPGWDIQNAFGLFLVANESYWVPRTTFESGARDVLRVANLFGLPTDRITDAFAAVGINLPVLVVGDPTGDFAGKAGGPFSPEKVRIKLSAKVPVQWDVTGVPNWLSISEKSGIVRGSTTLKLKLKPSARKLTQNQKAVLTFHNDTQPGQEPIRKTVKLTIKPKKNKQSGKTETMAVLELE